MFFDIVTTHNDHPSYVKHVLGSFMCCLPYLGIGCWGGQVSPKGLVHNLLMQSFTLGISKIEIWKFFF